MLTVSKMGFLTLSFAGLAAAGMMAQRAEARPQYLKQFGSQYSGLAEAVESTRCSVCHTTSKKEHNAYGAAVLAALAHPNAKEEADIAAALTKAEAGSSSTAGKTFGEMIQAGKLPN